MSHTTRRIDRRAFLTVAGAAGIWPLLDSAVFAQATSGPTVDTTLGKVRGRLHTGIHAFKGIPYGASTGGAKRFMAPAKAAPWTGVREAVRYGHQSPQNMRFTEVLAPQADPAEGFDEDCLNLNVWTPGVNDGRKRPVMFWCHGGGFAQESGSWPWIDGESLARRGDAVVVTVNHRLTVFGYLHLADVGGAKYAASGNAGMLDLVLALEWVRDNVASFGGDPGNVLIFGESGGGAKVCTLLAMPAAKGLFHRAAIQSGANLRSVTRDAANASTKALLDRLQVSAERIDTLQTMPTARILEAIAAARGGGPGPGGPMTFAPVMDGSILPTHPFDPVASPVSATVPLLVGCTAHEQTLFALTDEGAFNLDDAGLRNRAERLVGGQHVERVLATYRKAHPRETPSGLYFLISTDRGMRMNAIRLSERKVMQAQAPVYMYLFAWPSPALGGRLRATHTVEIPFVFDNTQIPKTMTTGGAEVKALAAQTSEAWVAFARTGNPNHKALPTWPAYATAQRATMVFDAPAPAVVNDPGRAERELWTSLG
jgi:para-nitrobenzyl esterase